MPGEYAYKLKLKIGGVDVTNLLRHRSDHFQKIDPDTAPAITVSAEQFQQIADADREARGRLGNGRFDSKYFRDAIEKILSDADVSILERGTARLVVAEL